MLADNEQNMIAFLAVLCRLIDLSPEVTDYYCCDFVAPRSTARIHTCR